MKANRFFTLVELLIVIAIIAILVAMLMPAISGAKKMARSIQCVSNERQLLVAINSYLNDYDAVFPSAKINAINWGEQLCQYLNMKYSSGNMPRNSVYSCPEQQTWTGTFGRTSYAYNSYLFGGDDYAPINGNPFWGLARTPPPPIKTNNITSPSLQLVFVDSWTGPSTADSRMGGYPFLDSSNYFAFRHNKHSTNVAYLAGNVKNESYVYIKYCHPAYYPVNATCQNKPRYVYDFVTVTDFSPY